MNSTFSSNNLITKIIQQHFSRSETSQTRKRRR